MFLSFTSNGSKVPCRLETLIYGQKNDERSKIAMVYMIAKPNFGENHVYATKPKDNCTIHIAICHIHDSNMPYTRI